PPTNGALSQEVLNALNEAIITAANENNIPVINVYRALNELTGSGLDNTGSLSVSPNGGGSLSNSDVNTYGVNRLNYVILQTLTRLRTSIFP
ncbi:MAG: hypothetical protein IAE80_24140, partial [Anaerolinea sp.]|nr:hypothetical protein [Anaerolinea sp.]